MIKNMLIVGLGGGAGSILRYIVQKLLQQQSTAVFPTGTFLINITGCFLIGLFWGFFTRTSYLNDEIKLLLMTGVCGGFTTFSAFTLESIGLLKENKTTLFLVYIFGSVLLGLLFTLLGIRLVK